MRIGVLSDTHLRFFGDLPGEIIKRLSNVDLIIHAGDFTTLDVFENLKQLAEVKAVRGNMDSAELRSLLPDREIVLAQGKKLGIMHGSGSPWGIEARLKEAFGKVDAIIYGHTHEARNKVLGGTLFFNPGPARNSFGILIIGNDIRGEIIDL